ncbi:MAG: hypothetical protein ACR2N4_12525 [Jatrophihabitans sp.]
MTATVPAASQPDSAHCPVTRLGVLGPTRHGQAGELARAALVPLIGCLEPELRPLVSRYLCSATVVLDRPEYTSDVLEYRFGVRGGSSVLTDGVYYWRRDAPDYIRTYGIGLDAAAISHMRQRNWIAPELTADTARSIEDYLRGQLAGCQEREFSPGWPAG